MENVCSVSLADRQIEMSYDPIWLRADAMFDESVAVQLTFNRMSEGLV